MPDDGAYTLHFVEFDAQGWAFPDTPEAGGEGAPSRQIDCAIADLVRKLSPADPQEPSTGKDASVLSFVYVHGRKHRRPDRAAEPRLRGKPL